MAARFLPVISLLSLVFPTPWSDAGPESAIPLEHSATATPFRAGDRLQLDVKTSGESDIEVITVVEASNWPWVLVRIDKAAKAEELWINFAQIRNVRRLAGR